MTQENKELLLKDLCARLPYGVKCEVIRRRIDGEMVFIRNRSGALELTINNIKELVTDNLYEIKPYLFPLSSMTEGQCEELSNLIHEHFILDDGFNEGISFKTYGDILVWLDEKPINECYFIFDYFNKNHLDYRGFISMSLALDATGLNIY